MITANAHEYEDRFLRIVCADIELLRAEFGEIIAANW